jgi:hypothetical protein
MKVVRRHRPLGAGNFRASVGRKEQSLEYGLFCISGFLYDGHSQIPKYPPLSFASK